MAISATALAAVVLVLVFTVVLQIDTPARSAGSGDVRGVAPVHPVSPDRSAAAKSAKRLPSWYLPVRDLIRPGSGAGTLALRP
jgi:hypothetical protein